MDELVPTPVLAIFLDCEVLLHRQSRRREEADLCGPCRSFTSFNPGRPFPARAPTSFMELAVLPADERLGPDGRDGGRSLKANRP